MACSLWLFDLNESIAEPVIFRYFSTAYKKSNNFFVLCKIITHYLAMMHRRPKWLPWAVQEVTCQSPSAQCAGGRTKPHCGKWWSHWNWGVHCWACMSNPYNWNRLCYSFVSGPEHIMTNHSILIIRNLDRIVCQIHKPQKIKEGLLPISCQ